MKKIKLIAIAMLAVLSLNAAGGNKLTIPVFGEVPFVQTGDLYSLDLGKLGKFSFQGSIEPLSLTASVGIDDLKAFPGATVMSFLGLQDIEMTITSKAFEIAANIDDKFKDDIVDEVRKIKAIAPVVEAVLNTLEIRESRAALTFNKSMSLIGELDLNVFVFGGKLPIPDIKGEIDPKKIINTIVDKVKDVATDELAKVGKVVADAAVESGKAIADAFNDAMKIAKTASKYVTKTKSEIDKHYVPEHARKMSAKIHWPGNYAMCKFYDNVMPTLVKIQGRDKAKTAELRKKHIDANWNKLIAQIDRDWSKVRGDKSYIRFYIKPSSATNGGHIFRAKVDDYKSSHLTFRREVYNRLLNDTKFDGLLENYWPNVIHGAEVKLRNKWKKTFINIENGSPRCSEIASGWASAKWILEHEKGSDIVRIKNVWKGAYLHIEHGKLECTPIGKGMHSSHWVIERIPGQNSVRIRNRWKGSLYLHIEHGKLDCSTIYFAWHSAMWNLGYVRYPEVPKPIVATNKHVRLTNLWKKTSVNVERGPVICGGIAPGWLSAKWIFERVPNTAYVRIKNVWKNTYLHVEHGRIESTNIGVGAHSSMWLIEKVSGANQYRIKNRWKNTYLHIERGKLECGEIAPGWHSAKWILDYL